MRNADRATFITAFAVLLCAALAVGCSTARVKYVDTGRSYDATAALTVLAQTDASRLSGQATTNGPRLRTRALAELTRMGSSGSEAASLLTRSFPSDAGGVPLYVERVTFSGKPSLLVVEAAGRAGGTLDYKRLWVIEQDGEVLFAGSR